MKNRKRGKEKEKEKKEKGKSLEFVNLPLIFFFDGPTTKYSVY